jgi:hypothetical protein
MILLMDYSDDEDSASLLNRNDGPQGVFLISYPGNGWSILVPAGCGNFHETKINQHQHVNMAHWRN